MLVITAEQWSVLQRASAADAHRQHVQDILALWRIFHQRLMPDYPQLPDATIELCIEHCLTFCAGLEAANVRIAAEFAVYILAAILQGRPRMFIVDMEEFFRESAPAYGFALPWIRYELFQVLLPTSLAP